MQRKHRGQLERRHADDWVVSLRGLKKELDEPGNKTAPGFVRELHDTPARVICISERAIKHLVPFINRSRAECSAASFDLTGGLVGLLFGCCGGRAYQLSCMQTIQPGSKRVLLYM